MSDVSDHLPIIVLYTNHFNINKNTSKINIQLCLIYHLIKIILTKLEIFQ